LGREIALSDRKEENILRFLICSCSFFSYRVTYSGLCPLVCLCSCSYFYFYFFPVLFLGLCSFLSFLWTDSFLFYSFLFLFLVVLSPDFLICS